MRWAGVTLMAALIWVSLGAGQGLKTPADWKWVPDSPAKVIDTGEAKADAIFFVAMRPGWHITQGPGSIFYQPDYQARGNFAIEAEIFLFPDSSAEEYGLFTGGRSLDAGATYSAFLARRDGQTAVLDRKPSGVVTVTGHPTEDAVPSSRSSTAVSLSTTRGAARMET